MKVRSGFVSNSSSSSFCLIGTMVNREQVEIACKKKQPNKDFNDDCIYDNIYELVRNTELSMQGTEDDFAIGMSIRKMSYNETLKEFQDRVLKEIHRCYDDKITSLDIIIGCTDAGGMTSFE